MNERNANEARKPTRRSHPTPSPPTVRRLPSGKRTDRQGQGPCSWSTTLLEPSLEVLARFTDHSMALSQGDLARLTGLSRSTTHKCVVRLTALGLLAETASRRYCLSDSPLTIRVLRVSPES